VCCATGNGLKCWILFSLQSLCSEWPWGPSNLHTLLWVPRVTVAVIVTGWYRTRRPMHCHNFWSMVCPHPSFNHSLFFHHSSLAITSRDTLYRSRINMVRNGREYCTLSISFHTSRVLLTCRKSYDMGPTALLPPPPKKVALRIFIALKNPSSEAGFEPAILGSNGKHAEH
jgi:hypothetical protein